MKFSFLPERAMLYQLLLENVKCGGCANTIRKVAMAASAETLQHVVIDPAQGLLTFEAENLPEETLLAIKQALAKAGYPEAGSINTLGNKVQSFVSCAVGRLDNSTKEGH
jgi:copper chaperone CopZ